MATSFVKSSIPAGTPGTAALFNHAETQADCIVTDLAAGSLPINVSALTGTIAAARLPTKNATIFLSAAGGKPRTTSGCAPVAWTELGTNKIMLPTLDFDKDSDEFVQWPAFTMPDGYTGGTITARFFWTAASGSAGDTVAWYIEARTFANDDALDQALSAGAGTSDALITANDVHITSAVNLTPAGTPVGGELIIIEVMRDVSADNLGVDARLIGVQLEYPTTYED